jgi:hypothetical protein
MRQASACPDGEKGSEAIEEPDTVGGVNPAVHVVIEERGEPVSGNPTHLVEVQDDVRKVGPAVPVRVLVQPVIIRISPKADAAGDGYGEERSGAVERVTGGSPDIGVLPSPISTVERRAVGAVIVSSVRSQVEGSPSGARRAGRAGCAATATGLSSCTLGDGHQRIALPTAAVKVIRTCPPQTRARRRPSFAKGILLRLLFFRSAPGLNAPATVGSLKSRPGD